MLIRSLKRDCRRSWLTIAQKRKVEEKDRSWCSSDKANDNRAITIEVASDTTHPCAVTDAAYNALIELLAGICVRNGIESLKWQADKSLVGKVDKQNMTAYRWFANKSCPGDYLYSRHGAIASAVNAKLEAAGSDGFTTTKSGRTAESTAPAGKSADEVAKEVIAGKWGDGDARKEALTAAEYDYSAVQAAVN